MVYLIVETYGKGWPEYHAFSRQADKPHPYPTLEALAVNLKALRKQQADFVAINPKQNGAAQYTVVAAEPIPTERKVRSSDATRPLNPVEKRQLEQLAPGR